MTTETVVPGPPAPATHDALAESELETIWSDTRLMRSLLIGIFMFIAIYALYFARDFFMPVVLAFLLALMLTPIVRFLKKRGVPEAAVGDACWCSWPSIGIGGTGYFLSGPVIELGQRRARDRPPA